MKNRFSKFDLEQESKRWINIIDARFNISSNKCCKCGCDLDIDNTVKWNASVFKNNVVKRFTYKVCKQCDTTENDIVKFLLSYGFIEVDNFE